MAAGIYIHIPFCERKCPYCDFYSLRSSAALRAEYVAALERETALFPALRADTLYFGGGTPSLLEPREIARLIEAAQGRFCLSEGAEITLECNPASADAHKLRALREAGVNRLSIGVQSTDDRVLRAAGRLHTALEALKTLADAREAGFDNVSADIMIGLPGETGAELEKTARELCEAGAAHISAYILKIMDGTPFAERIPEGTPGDDEAAALYELACGALDAAGLEQYEISNFARSSEYESRHNKKYWECGEWIGLGAAAHSSIGGERFSFTRDIGKFLGAFGEGRPVSEGAYRETLDFEGALDGGDYIMLRLRTSEGLSLSKLYESYNIALNKHQVDFIRELARGGLARFDGETLALTRRGWLVSNSIIAELLP